MRLMEWVPDEVMLWDLEAVVGPRGLESPAPKTAEFRSHNVAVGAVARG